MRGPRHNTPLRLHCRYAYIALRKNHGTSFRPRAGRAGTDCRNIENDSQSTLSAIPAEVTQSEEPDRHGSHDTIVFAGRRADAGRGGLLCPPREGEVGLIVSEGTVVNRPASSNDPDIPRFYGVEPLLGWKAVIDKVHADSGVMAPQLWHMGVVAPKDSGWLPPAPFEGPSGLVVAREDRRCRHDGRRYHRDDPGVCAMRRQMPKPWDLTRSKFMEPMAT